MFSRLFVVRARKKARAVTRRNGRAEGSFSYARDMVFAPEYAVKVVKTTALLLI